MQPLLCHGITSCTQIHIRRVYVANKVMMGYMIARVIAIALRCHQREGLIPTKVSILALIILNSYHFGSGWEWGGGIGV